MAKGASAVPTSAGELKEALTLRRGLRDHAGLLAAVMPLVGIGIAAFAYLFGANNRIAYEDSFGILGLVEHDLYNILSDGSYYLAVSLFLSGAAAVILWALFRKTRTFRSGLLVFFVCGIFLGFFVSGGLGSLAGVLRAKVMVYSVQGECHRCLAYGTNSHTIYGRPVASDSTRVVILSPDEKLTIMEWDRITSIRPAGLDAKKQGPRQTRAERLQM